MSSGWIKGRMRLGILERRKIENLMNLLWLKILTRDEISEQVKNDLNEGKISKREFDSITKEIYTSIR